VAVVGIGREGSFFVCVAQMGETYSQLSLYTEEVCVCGGGGGDTREGKRSVEVLKF
jgi:hypothetical protein